MRNIDPKRAKWISVRMAILSGLLGLGLCSIIGSAYNLQVKWGPAWRTIAEKQRQKRVTEDPIRGSILDRAGELVAVSVDVPSIAINTVEMTRDVPINRVPALVASNAQRLAAALSLPVDEVHNKLKSQRRFVWLKRRLAQNEVTALRQMMDIHRPDAIRGVMLEGEGHRFYPGREALWGLVGFVGADGKGLDGLEKSMDDTLAGTSENVSAMRDRQGALVFGDAVSDEQFVAGNNVQLTLDLGLQFQVQEDLEAGLHAFEAKAASAIVVDPATGEILALASAPSFNPNDYSETPLEERRNHAVSDRVEPGSVMKIFTIASAIADGKLGPTEEIFCENGAWVVDHATIHDTHPEGNLTPADVIAKSSNICAAKIGRRLGEEGLYSAFKRFGFGEPTGIELPGEAGGILRAKGRPWIELEVLTASFGQGISVTPLQLAMAMSAIANGGKLYEPMLVSKVIAPNGNIVSANAPKLKRQVVSATAAKWVADMMTGVVEEGGTGREAYIPGYRVAGKTATAQKANAKTGKYDPDKFVSSFVGFLPAQHPRFVIAVVVDEPWVAHLGGQVAAPIFRSIAMHALARYGVAPSGDVARVAVNFPVEDPALRAYASVAAAASSDLTGPEGAIASPKSSSAPRVGEVINIPSVSGLPAREALKVLLASGLQVQFDGSGVAVAQEPRAGESITKGGTVVVHLSPG